MRELKTRAFPDEQMWRPAPAAAGGGYDGRHSDSEDDSHYDASPGTPPALGIAYASSFDSADTLRNIRGNYLSILSLHYLSILSLHASPRVRFQLQ
jgi:hypothetical protein